MKNNQLNTQLSWAYDREFGDKRKERETDYNRTLSEVLERSNMLKSEFLLLAWMVAHVGQEYEKKKVAEEVGMCEEEVDMCFVRLSCKCLIEESENGLYEVVPSRIEKYYEEQESDGANEPARAEKVEEYSVSEQDIFDDLKKIAKDYKKYDYIRFDSSRFEKFAEKSPEAQFSKGYLELFPSLTHDEQNALAFLAGHMIWKGFVPFDYSNDCVESDEFESLIQKGLAMVYPQEVVKDDERPDNRIIISYKACKALFQGHRELVKYGLLSQQTEVIKYDEISEKELYYETQDQNVVETLRKIVSEENYQEVIKRLKRKGRNMGISVILHGGPGVGKTELIKQLARQSKRDIFNIDVSKVYGTYWGETEKNVRAIFRNFKYMTSLCPNAPILLFNEADGILKDRGAGNRGQISRAEDIVQTIILQEMEKIDGFFFATTNIAQNIDKAFARRFLFKLEVHSPGKETRTKIWGSLIPDLDIKQREYLAEHFMFSGGQIENISRRKDIFEALEGRTPTAAEMEAFCNEENENFQKGACAKIGFLIGGKEEKKEPLNTKRVKR